STPASSGSCAFAANATGTFEFRLIRGNTANPPRAVSASFTVVAPTLSVSTSSITQGGSISVSWANADPSAGDWIGLYAVGTSNFADLSWSYLNCLKTVPGATPAAAGSCSFTVNTAGTLEFRLIRGNTSNPPRAVSPSFTSISNATNTPTLTPTPTATSTP